MWVLHVILMVVGKIGMATIQAPFFMAFDYVLAWLQTKQHNFTIFSHCLDLAIANFWLDMLGHQTK